MTAVPTTSRAWQTPYFGFEGEELGPGSQPALTGLGLDPQLKHLDSTVKAEFSSMQQEA